VREDIARGSFEEKQGHPMAVAKNATHLVGLFFFFFFFTKKKEKKLRTTFKCESFALSREQKDRTAWTLRVTKKVRTVWTSFTLV
jgi:hypothetical protein